MLSQYLVVSDIVAQTWRVERVRCEEGLHPRVKGAKLALMGFYTNEYTNSVIMMASFLFLSVFGLCFFSSLSTNFETNTMGLQINKHVEIS